MIPVRVLRIRGTASPIMGIVGRSKSIRGNSGLAPMAGVGDGTGVAVDVPVGVAVGGLVAVGVSVLVGVAVGVLVGV